MFLAFLLPQRMLLLVSSAGSFFNYWDALGLGPWASCFLCTHALMISFSLLPTKAIYRLLSPTQTLYLDARLLYWTAYSTSPCGYLIDTPKLTMSQVEPPIFPQTGPAHSYPVCMGKGWQIPFSSVQRFKTLESISTLLFPSRPTCRLSGSPVFSIFKIHPESAFSPPPLLPPCLEPPPFLIIYTVAVATSLAACPRSCPTVVCSPPSCQNDPVRPRVK